MVPSITSGAVLRLTLVAVATLSVAACSRPKPKFDTQAQTTAAPTTQLPPSRTEPPGSVGTAPSGPMAGSAQDFVVNVGDRVYFDTDAHDVRDDARPILEGQAGWLRRYPNVRVRIEGNADERGTREYNLALGARRANAVRDYLVAQGVSSGRISTISFGKEQPIDPGTSEESYQRNRNGHTAIVDGAR
jgi:peptidoglycan-associated lipoprotein